jgi:hypothetical protein
MGDRRMKLRNLLISIFATLLISACSSFLYSSNTKELQEMLQEMRARSAKADEMFQERCKKAGEFIYRTAENVEGVFLLKLRSEKMNKRDQYRMNDPYGNDFDGIKKGNAYIETFLQARNEKGFLDNKEVGGYLYVDAIDPEDGKRYRYTGRIDQPWLRDKRYGEWVREFVLDKVPAPDPAPRYGVTYDDISTREERDYWIAGSSLRVIDLKTNEVIAERIGYMMDRDQGDESFGRAQWLFAARNACPEFPGFRQVSQTRNFVEKVLHLTKEK